MSSMWGMRFEVMDAIIQLGKSFLRYSSLTLGLFLFVVNGIVIKICVALVPDFEVTTWTAAIIDYDFLE